MDVLHCHLEPIEAPGLWDLNFSHESLSQIFQNNSVRSGKESENVLDEMLLTLGKFTPVFEILTEINFLGCPEASHLVLVHFPNVVVMDGQDHKSVGVLIEDGLWKQTLGLILGLRWDHLVLNSSMLAVVIANQLRTKLIDNTFALRVLRTLRSLEVDLLLTETIMVGENICDFLLMISHFKNLESVVN